MAPVLGYWKIRAIAQPIRFLLEYTGTEYEQKIYESGPAPDFDKSQWLDVKNKLGLDFPNLPYYIDGDLKLTESIAIMRYISRKHGLCGKSEGEVIRVDTLASQVDEFRWVWNRLCYNPNFENDKVQFIKDLPAKIKQYSDYLGNRKWFAGENLTFVDFMLYELFDQLKHLVPDCMESTPNLKNFSTRFENLDSIKKYMNSKKFMKGPLQNKHAKFGGKL